MIHLLAAMLDAACAPLQAQLDEAVVAREMTRTPHLLLVDRAGYGRFIPHLAEWMWEWLVKELQAQDAILLRGRPINMQATSVLDDEHGPECGVGGETLGAGAGFLDGETHAPGFKGVGFWCSAENPESCEVSFEISPPAKLRTLRVDYKNASSWPGRSGILMIPADTLMMLSSDGGKTYPVAIRSGQRSGYGGEYDGVQLPDAPKTTHVKLRLRGKAVWFAIRDISYTAEQDAQTAMQVTKDYAVAYLADRQSTVATSSVPFVRDLMRVAHNLIHSLLPHALSKVYRVDYGLIQQGDKVTIKPASDTAMLPPRRLLTAVPFIGKDSPSPSAEFAHSDIIILRKTQTTPTTSF